jgi:hypothetical protein
MPEAVKVEYASIRKRKTDITELSRFLNRLKQKTTKPGAF